MAVAELEASTTPVNEQTAPPVTSLVDTQLAATGPTELPAEDIALPGDEPPAQKGVFYDTTATVEKEDSVGIPELPAEEVIIKKAGIAAAHIPTEVLQKILYQVDPETFSSATLVNRNWRSAAEDAKLYAHHLSRSPVYSRLNNVISEPLDDTRLVELKRKFAQEAKRSLYIPFLRPRITIVNLISETPLSSFAAGPGGEKFEFTFSAYGRWCLAISSSRIYVIDLKGGKSGILPGPELATQTTVGTAPEGVTDTGAADAKGKSVVSGHEPATETTVGAVAEGVTEAGVADAKGKLVALGQEETVESIIRVTKELKVVRRPLAADILSDGSVLAVLSSDLKVSLYNVHDDKVELRRTVDLDNPPYTIAMSPGGEILAAAFDGGMELCSLRPGASPSERRTVKSDRVDKLMFSSDGSMLLGTTQTKDPATVILSAPYFNAMEHDLTQAELVNSMWTQQILFPSSSRDCSHSTLLPRYSDDNSNWTLTYDRTYESFRAVRTDDLRNGTTYFTGPQTGTDRRVQWPKDALIPSSLPSATTKGDLVAAGFKGSEIWLYGVPENLDANTNTQAASGGLQPGTATGSSNDDNISTSESTNSENERPRWQMLVDKYRNVFSKGKKVADVAGVSAMCWYKAAESSEGPTMYKTSERLIVAAPGGVGSEFILDEETPVEGGRLVVLDFNLEPHDGAVEEVTIELGNTEPLLLEEQKTDMEAEIAKVRRRTLATRDAARVRSVIDALRPNNGLEDIPDVPEVPGAYDTGTETFRRNADHPDVSDDDEPGVSVEEAAAFAEGPYSHTSPRSGAALYRSATVSAATRQTQRQNRYLEPRHMPLRRTDGTEVPDESDADQWVPPPPPYQRYNDEQLPDDLVQRALLYNGIAPIPSTFDALLRPRRSSSVNTDNRSTRRRSSVDTDLLTQHLRPRIGDDQYIAGNTTAVSSTTVTPRTSIRRRPLTTYTSSSSVALRDSSIARPISHLTRSSSVNSATMFLSRSESLRRTSVAGSSLAQSPPQNMLHESTNWPLPEHREQPEPISPPEESSDPMAQVQIPFQPSPAPSETAFLPPTEESEVVSIPSPTSGSAPVSPEEKMINVPPPDDDEPISPRATAPLNLPVAPWVDTPPQQDSPPAQQPTSLPATSAARSEDDGHQPQLVSATVPAISQMSQPAVIPRVPVPQRQESVSRAAVPTGETRQQPKRFSYPGMLEEHYQTPFEADSSVTSPPAPATFSPSPAPETTSVPEPSAYQIASMQTRPRPHARQLSGSHQIQPSFPQPALNSPTPTTYTAYSQSAWSTAQASASGQPQRSSERASDAASIKSRKRKNRLSQRLRGAFRRADPDEPMPELPIIPGISNTAQPSPSLSASAQAPVQGPARHSQLYANNRHNASEPMLRRPQAQRLETINSVASQLGRIPSVRQQQAMAPAPLQEIPEGRKPRPKRSRSIFGGRRRSQVGAAVVEPGEMPPPMPSMPSAYMDAGMERTASVPLVQRAATEDVGGYYGVEGQGRGGVQTEISAGKRRGKKDKDKDGKCVVM